MSVPLTATRIGAPLCRVAVSRWLGHSSPEITYRVYAYLKPDDELATRAAMAETLSEIVPDVYMSCTQVPSR